MISIVCTSRPSDGLLYYSYEYCQELNSIGVPAQLVIVSDPKFPEEAYSNSIKEKYTSYNNVIINEMPDEHDITLVMGRSMITLPYLNRKQYQAENFFILMELFSGKLISVYSENQPEDYPKAIDFFGPDKVFDLCDHEVYPNGVGLDFKKTISFKHHIEPKGFPEFTYLFLGTTREYYESALKHIDDYPDSAILVYPGSDYINKRYNHLLAPSKRLMERFEIYVYVKETFDPAPRLMQECKYFGKGVMYLRDKSIVDGGSVYWKRDPEDPDLTPILDAIKALK